MTDKPRLNGLPRAKLQDMRRFYDVFEIREPAAGNSLSSAIWQPVAAESDDRLLAAEIVWPDVGERGNLNFHD